MPTERIELRKLKQMQDFKSEVEASTTTTKRKNFKTSSKLKLNSILLLYLQLESTLNSRKQRRLLGAGAEPQVVAGLPALPPADHVARRSAAEFRLQRWSRLRNSNSSLRCRRRRRHVLTLLPPNPCVSFPFASTNSAASTRCQ